MSLLFLFTKVKRYFEIAKLYELCEMKRLATFYKWISAVRVFKLIENNNQDLSSTEYYNLNCIVRRSINQVLSVITNMKILPQLPPNLKLCDQSIINRGFPDAKKCLIFQLIKLFNYNKCYNESNK